MLVSVAARIIAQRSSAFVIDGDQVLVSLAVPGVLAASDRMLGLDFAAIRDSYSSRPHDVTVRLTVFERCSRKICPLKSSQKSSEASI